MASPKPTVVIAPGAWQRPSGFSSFAAQLRHAGHATEVVAYPSVGGTATPLPGLAEDVAATRAVLTKLLDNGGEAEVLLLCHSYGGVVGSCAVEGFSVVERERAGRKGGVRLVVYMAAFMIPKGSSLLQMLGGQPLPWMDVQGDKTTAVASLLPQVAFNDLPAEQAEQYAQDVTHSSSVVFATPSTFEPWAHGIRCAYIFCTEDRALPYPNQQQMAAQLGAGPVTWTLKAGHCPFLSVPEQLLEVVLEAAEVR
ncbi:hypothetical protein BUE80_DR005105 [Diplocarpon rosae]|nr:hypothetical protein BUE80_DR005105 [Diplocarpon rosae]